MYPRLCEAETASHKLYYAKQKRAQERERAKHEIITDLQRDRAYLSAGKYGGRGGGHYI